MGRLRRHRSRCCKVGIFETEPLRLLWEMRMKMVMIFGRGAVFLVGRRYCVDGVIFVERCGISEAEAALRIQCCSFLYFDSEIN